MVAEEIPIYFPKDLYHSTKVGVKGILDSFGLEWDFDEKCWIGKSGKVVGEFQGHKKPALLRVSGTDALINEMKTFAERIGAEIREADVKDIRVRRQEEKEEREAKRIIEEKLKAKKEVEEKEALESVIKEKIAKMKNMEVSPTFMRNWIKMEHGVDVSEMLGIPKEGEKPRTLEGYIKEPDKKEHVKAVKESYLCKKGSHDMCGGHGCSCKCHEGN